MMDQKAADVRLGQMTASVDRLRRSHERWSEDPQSTPIPDDRLVEDINTCIVICTTGDCPAKGRQLADAVSRFEFEWKRYDSLERVSADGTPLDVLWAAYRAVLVARQGAIEPKLRELESVHQLLNDPVNPLTPLQIAKLYGRRSGREDAAGVAIWEGPFFGADGDVLHNEILKQAKAEASGSDKDRVIPKDWIHPDEIERVDGERLELERCLSRLEQAEEDAESVPYVDPARVEDLLRQGQVFATIAKVKRVSLEDVRKIANDLGIEPYDSDSPETWEQQQGDEPRQDPVLKGTEDGPLAGQAAATEDGEGMPNDDPVSELSRERLESVVCEIVDADKNMSMTAGDIARQVNDQFSTTVSVQMVSHIMRNRMPAAAGASKAE